MGTNTPILFDSHATDRIPYRAPGSDEPSNTANMGLE
jgi:hypothetical protein